MEQKQTKSKIINDAGGARRIRSLPKTDRLEISIKVAEELGRPRAAKKCQRALVREYMEGAKIYMKMRMFTSALDGCLFVAMPYANKIGAEDLEKEAKIAGLEMGLQRGVGETKNLKHRRYDGGRRDRAYEECDWEISEFNSHCAKLGCEKATPEEIKEAGKRAVMAVLRDERNPSVEVFEPDQVIEGLSEATGLTKEDQEACRQQIEEEKKVGPRTELELIRDLAQKWESWPE